MVFMNPKNIPLFERAIATPIKIIVLVSLLSFNSFSTTLAQVRTIADPYPLDGIVDKQGEPVVVDRNLPGLWKFKDDQASVFVQGAKELRKPLNACACLAVGPTGELYVGDSATREIYEVDDAGKFTALTGGLIGVPVDLVVAADGTLYIADLERRCVWKWDRETEKLPSVYLEKANARGLALDDQNRLWVVSQNPQQLVLYDSDGKAEVLVSERKMNFPHQIVLDSQGNAWISDNYSKAIWKFSSDNKLEKAIESDLLQSPVGLFWYKEELAIVDPHAATVFLADKQNKLRVWLNVKKSNDE